jgi:hypothetical protein
MKPKRTWREKLNDDKGFPKIGKIQGKMSRRWGTGTMVIPAPREVDALMRQVKKGWLTTIDDLRRRLAKAHGVTIACPMTTGIFAWIAAHAADEAESDGAKRVTPYWRTLKTGGELNPKYPGGIDGVKSRLEAEGHVVVQRGKRFFVEDHEVRLSDLS